MKQLPNYKFHIFMDEVVVENQPHWDYGKQIRRGYNPADNDCEWMPIGKYKLNIRSDMLDFQSFLQRIGDQEVYLEDDNVKPTIERALNKLNLIPCETKRIKTVSDRKIKVASDRKGFWKTICQYAITISVIALIVDPRAGLGLLFLSFILSSICISKKFLWGVLIIFILIGST